KILVDSVVLLVGIDGIRNGNKEVSLRGTGVRCEEIRGRPFGKVGNAVLRDRIVGEWLAVQGINDWSTEPAGPHVRSGYVHKGAVALPRNLLFVVGEKEGPVLSVVHLWNPHRSAERVAELVLI